MTPCRLLHELANRHDQALTMYRDDTPEQTAAHRLAVDLAWQAVHEHRGTCAECSGRQQRHDTPERRVEPWLPVASQSRTKAATERQHWRGYD